MKKLINKPENVVVEELEGVALAHADLARAAAIRTGLASAAGAARAFAHIAGVLAVDVDVLFHAERGSALGKALSGQMTVDEAVTRMQADARAKIREMNE